MFERSPSRTRFVRVTPETVKKHRLEAAQEQRDNGRLAIVDSMKRQTAVHHMAATIQGSEEVRLSLGEAEPTNG